MIILVLISYFLGESYVSVATNDQYAHGAIALGRSLRDTNTTKKLTLMITEQVTEELR